MRAGLCTRIHLPLPSACRTRRGWTGLASLCSGRWPCTMGSVGRAILVPWLQSSFLQWCPAWGLSPPSSLPPLPPCALNRWGSLSHGRWGGLGFLIVWGQCLLSTPSKETGEKSLYMSRDWGQRAFDLKSSPRLGSGWCYWSGYCTISRIPGFRCSASCHCKSSRRLGAPAVLPSLSYTPYTWQNKYWSDQVSWYFSGNWWQFIAQ